MLRDNFTTFKYLHIRKRLEPKYERKCSSDNSIIKMKSQAKEWEKYSPLPI